MILVEAVFVIGLVGALVYLLVRFLLPEQEQRHAPPITGKWRVAHYDAKGETHVVLQKVSDTKVLDEHVIATFRADDPEYDQKFLSAMNTARQRLALFETEEE